MSSPEEELPKCLCALSKDKVLRESPRTAAVSAANFLALETMGRQVPGKLTCAHITTVAVSGLLFTGFQYDRKGEKVSVWGQALVKMKTLPFCFKHMPVKVKFSLP